MLNNFFSYFIEIPELHKSVEQHEVDPAELLVATHTLLQPLLFAVIPSTTDLIFY